MQGYGIMMSTSYFLMAQEKNFPYMSVCVCVCVCVCEEKEADRGKEREKEETRKE